MVFILLVFVFHLNGVNQVWGESDYEFFFTQRSQCNAFDLILLELRNGFQVELLNHLVLFGIFLHEFININLSVVASDNESFRRRQDGLHIHCSLVEVARRTGKQSDELPLFVANDQLSLGVGNDKLFRTVEPSVAGVIVWGFCRSVC